MSYSSSWLIGSVVLGSAATITINGSDEDVAAGTYYLRDATAGRSLIDQVQAAIAAVVPGSTVAIGQDRKLRVTSGGAALTLTIPAALQPLLGLPASPAVGTTVTADSPSSLLWSPGWPETTVGHPVGTSGWRDHDDVQTASPSGLTSHTELHNYSTNTGLAWQYVGQDRLWTVDGGAPGEWERFRLDVLVPGHRWKLYSNVDEDEASASAVTWPSALGPYIRRGLQNGEWWDRSLKTVDTMGNVRVDAMITGEIGS